MSHVICVCRDFILLDRDEGIKAQVVQAELNEIERDLTLRRLLWESSEDLQKLVEEWTATPFDQLHVETVQKNVNRFTQTVYMLEKGTYRPVNHSQISSRFQCNRVDL